MKIAIASSGLGHVARGVEAWAATTAAALAEKGVDVVLFAAGAAERPTPHQSEHDAGQALNSSQPTRVVIPCLKRGSVAARAIAGCCSQLGGWRYGLGSRYQVEQTTFARGLVRELRDGNFDIVHLQDPWLAWLLQKAGSQGKHAAEVILAHGTEEDVAFLVLHCDSPSAM